MSSNAFGSFTPGKSGNPDKKKRKRKKKKKSDKNDASITTGTDTPRVKSFINMGYSREQVHQCFDTMFQAGEDMNDDKKVKECLQRIKSGTSIAMSNKSTNNSNNSNNNSNKGKKEASDNTSATTTTSKTSTGTSADAAAGSTASQSTSNGRAASSENTAVAAEPKPLPIDERLEEATKMPANVVMPVLIKWCRNFPNERPVLFESRALQQLFTNFLNDLMTKGHDLDPTQRQKYEQPMNELLRLAISSNDVADLITNQLSSFVGASSAMEMQSTEIKSVSETFAISLVQKIRTFHRATTYDENLPQQLGQLTRQLQEITSACRDAESQLRSDSENLATMFQLRDLRSEMSELLSKKAELLSSMGKDNSKTKSSNSNKNKKKSNNNNNKTVSDKAILISAGFSSTEIEKASSSQSSAQALKTQIHSMTTKQEKLMEPVRTKLSKTQSESRTLNERAETLRKELIAIESRLEECKGEEDELLVDQTRKEQKFDNDMTALNGKNDGLVNQLRRAESQTEVVKVLRLLEENISKLSNEKSMNSIDGKKKKSQEAQVLAMLEGSGGVEGTRKAAIQSTLEYVECESRCLERIRTRAEETKNKVETNEKELEQISKLGLGKVEVHLRATLSEQMENMNEDNGLVAHLEGQARDMLTSVQTIVASMVESGDVDGELAIVIGQVKAGFVELQCCGASASGWLIPKIPRARDNSNSFDSNKAASLGLSALIPKNYDASSEENVPAPIKKVVAPKPVASVFKGWGAPKSSGEAKISLATIQQAELMAKGE